MKTTYPIYFRSFLYIGLSTLAFTLSLAQAAEPPAATAAPSGTESTEEKLDVSLMRQKYWDKGDLDVRVVQNRLYTKAHRLELNVFAGMTSSDPFLSVKQLGASLGFHLTEYWAFSAVYWKPSTAHSSAWDALMAQSPAREPAVNPQLQYLGGEIAFSPIYGKLSLAGKKIIHYDMHLLAGLGKMETQAGAFMAPSLGLGQQFYLNRWAALRFDYRYLWYTDLVAGRERNTAAEVVNIGVGVLFP